jgi:FkbM family methyltransferase
MLARVPGHQHGARGIARAILSHPRLEPGVALLLRARLVRGSPRFLVRELRARAPRAAALYRLRIDPAIRVAVRHGTGDVVTLSEVFHNRDYEPPAIVEAALNSLGPSLRVLDLGANVGMFGAWAHHRWPGAQVTAYEPDPDNAGTHALVIEANTALASRWTLERAAAGAADGEATFVSGGVALSHLAGDGDGGARQIVVPVRDVLPAIAASDLVKIDIEGGEWALWADTRFSAGAPPVLVAEYHRHLCPGPGEARSAALSLLHRAGYSTIPIVHNNDHGAGMVWAHRP